MDRSKYSTTDMWDWFFTNNITKQDEAERQFQATHDFKINQQIKEVLRSQLKVYNKRLNTQKKQKGELKKLCPCPTSNEEQLLFEEIQLRDDENENDSSDGEQEAMGPSDVKKQNGCYKSFATLKS